MMLPLAISLTTSNTPLFPAAPRVSAQSTPSIGLFPRAIENLTLPVGAHISFKVNLTDAPSINNFNVFLSYNTTVLKATSPDDNGNILAGKTVFRFSYCIDGQIVDQSKGGCSLGSGGDGPGIVHIGQSILGDVTSNPTTGLLFTVHFDVLAVGFSQVQIRSYA